MAEEQEAVARLRGKWSQQGVPHKGWVCVSDYDAGEDEADFVTCEMCESMLVRSVQTMAHPDYERTLDCGCVCAGHMSGDLVRAQSRDKAMRSRATRRAHFPKRKGWKISSKGVDHIKVDGVHLMIVRKGDGRYQIGATPPGGTCQWGPLRYPSVDEAKRGCFDALMIVSGKA